MRPAAAVVALLLAPGVAWAGTIIGTPRADVLKGSARADKIYGKAGNDRLFGYGGSDLLVGGRGADVLVCGGGRDVAIADKSDKVRGCEVVKGLPKPSPPPVDDSRLYIALGDSISAGLGASSAAKAWVSLYFGYLSSNGIVTRLSNLARPGATSGDLRNFQLLSAVGLIDQTSDTQRLTIDIGGNDLLRLSSCDPPNTPSCLFAGNLRATLRALNDALARDPGDETVQIMELYNWDIGTPRESAQRTRLLGDDLKIDCSGTGLALGLNDLIHCIALEERASPVDVLPAFDAAGAAFLDVDHLHPNDAGYLAIANAFGGAVERQR